ncbi:MAG: nucleotidyltransferase family protein [Gammaproteobacteria bacterium]
MTDSCDVRDVIGLIPAGGQAARLGRLPCSKELYPIGFQQGPTRAPKVACHYLLECMRAAGIARAFIVLRAGKWDIPAYFGDGAWLSMDLAYLMMGAPFGAPYTLDQAWPFVRDARIALGFPDILFEPADAYARLLAHQSSTGAEVVLGLFPAARPHNCDMVALGAQGQVRQIVIKPAATELRYTWMIAVWTPVFTQFMHAHLVGLLDRQSLAARELFVGDVLQAAIDAGLRVEAECFDDGRALDIGTPEDLQHAVSRYSQLGRPMPR